LALVRSVEQLIEVYRIPFERSGCGGNGLALGHHPPPPPFLPPTLHFRQQSTDSTNTRDIGLVADMLVVDLRRSIKL